jgi:hypothetical protein
MIQLIFYSVVVKAASTIKTTLKFGETLISETIPSEAFLEGTSND